MKPLNVMYQSSAAYAIPAAVSLCSLFENNKDLAQIRVWFIDVGLTEEDRMHLSALAKKYGREITFLKSEDTDRMLSEAGVKLWSASYATFYKIFTSCSLTQLDRILYIDSDTLILDSLKDLCDYDMSGYACAMAASGMTGAIKKALDLPEYYNAGLVYYNLEYWREHHVEQDFIEVINDRECCSRYTIVADETLHNYVLRRRIKKMPLKYNFESSWWLWGWNQKLYPALGWSSAEQAYYGQKEIMEARRHPCIAHYVDLTTGRPWDYLNDNPFREQFEYYRELLHPWKEIEFRMRGIGGDNQWIARAKMIGKKVLPFSLRSRIGFRQHDLYWRARVKELQ